MVAPTYFIKYEYMPEFGQYMYQKYIPHVSLSELVDEDSDAREMVWNEVKVCQTLTGDFEDFTWIPMGLPVRGVA